MKQKKNIESIVGALLRSLAVSFPVTSNLAQLWTEYKGHLENERINAFFEETENLLSFYNERLKAVEQYVTQSQEFVPLLEKVLEQVQKEHSEYKRKKYPVLLLNILSKGPNVSYDYKSTLIDTLDFLTETDIKILTSFDKSGVFKVYQHIMLHKPKERADHEKILTGIVVSLSKLLSRGLIFEKVSLSVKSTDIYSKDKWFRAWRDKNFELIPFGKLLLEMLEPNKT